MKKYRKVRGRLAAPAVYQYRHFKVTETLRGSP